MMPKRIRRQRLFSALTMFGLLGCSAFVSGQQHEFPVLLQGERITKTKTAFLENRGRAIDLVDRAYELEGGASFEGLKSLFLRIDHWVFNRRQSANADRDAWLHKPVFDQILNIWNFEAQQFRSVETREFGGGMKFLFDTLMDDGMIYTIFPERSYYRTDAVMPDPYHGILAQPIDAWLAIIPARTLMLAKNQPDSLTYLGVVDLDGEPVEVVEFTWPASSKRPRFFFSSETGRVVALSSDFVSPFLGDHSNMIVFAGRQEKEGVSVPEEIYAHFDDGNILHRRIVDFGVDIGRFGQTIFELNSRLAKSPPTWRPISLGESVAGFEDVFSIEINNAYYVAMEDFVVVFDALRHPAISRTLIDRIRQETGKPVKYIVISHGHQEHLGGLRPFLEEGATVLTTASAVELVLEVAKAPSTKLGGGVFGSPVVEPAIELVRGDGEFVISDSNSSIVVRNIGDSPHAAENLVVYVESDDVLFEGDLYADFGPVNETFRFFSDWLRKEEFEETVVVGMHHDPIKAQDLRQFSDHRELSVDSYVESLQPRE